MWGTYQAIKNELLNELETGLKAIPKSPLKAVELIEDSDEYCSIGADGNIYAKDRNTGIKFSEDGAKTWTTHNFTSEYGEVRWVTKTHSGYVLICGGDKEEGGVGIYFSEEFDGEYELKITFPEESFFGALNIDHYHGLMEGERVILVAEYGHVQGVERSLYGTFDGGRTWKNMYTAVIKNSSENSHIHTAHYDRFTGRVYVGVGDKDNAGLYYTDNMGEDWIEITVPKNDIKKTRFQPTQIIATPTKLILGPDSDPLPVSVISMPLKSYGLGEVEFDELNLDLSIRNVQAYKFYPSDHIITDDGTIYILYKGDYESKDVYVVASGDNGKSFHVVFKMNIEAGDFLFDKYIVGVDKDGYIYGRQQKYIDGVYKKWNVKFQSVDWLYI